MTTITKTWPFAGLSESPLSDSNRRPFFLTMEALSRAKMAITRAFVKPYLGGDVPKLRSFGRGVSHGCSKIRAT
jgi:hypothetical protein